MKTDRNNIDNATDLKLRKVLQQQLPKPVNNPWFTRRVLNSLPEKPKSTKLRLLEFVFYILGIIAFIAGWILAGKNFLYSGFQLSTLIWLLTMPAITIFCVGVFAIPSFRKALQ